MEINESSLAMDYVSRLFGYAPYRIERTGSGSLNRFYGNFVLKVYSIGLLMTLVVLCSIGLYRDVEAKVSLRMKSTTAKIATALDVNVVVSSCLLGVISGNVGFCQIQEVNRRLKEADDILFVYIGRDDQVKRRASKLLLTIYTAILSLLALDVYGWYRKAIKKASPTTVVNLVTNLCWYIPFYTLYVFLLTLQIQFTYISWNIGTRYKRLNFALSSTFFKEKLFEHHRNVGFAATIIGQQCNKDENALRRDRAAHWHNSYLKNFAYVHESLGKVVISISSYFGLTLLMLLSSCFLHLTVTAYFLILSLLVEENEIEPFHILLQLIWLVFHTFRLLLIVEPCNMASVELESFWQQLTTGKTYFSAKGICTIDRSILTTILWSITTYLVILLQFEKIFG